ncbi:MAG: hypothetical protein ACSHYF_11960 [Verrucomicrobiaceae bacterium]
MSDWAKILIPSSIGLFTAVGAAYLSALWATRRAFQQRWWERKEQAYTEIVEALYAIIRYFDITAEAYLFMTEADHPKKAEFHQAYSEAHWRIERATDIGGFVISDEAASVLQNLRKRPKLSWEENAPWEVYEEESKHFRSALAEVRKLAKRDLQI